MAAIAMEMAKMRYLVPLDVVVTGNITAKICEIWSEFKKNCTLVTMATAEIDETW
jgi:hypothetical protein